MKYRELGKTGMMFSEIGLGAEWLERHGREEVLDVVRICEEHGVNVFDCWNSEPQIRDNLGLAIAGKRDKWYIQSHIGSTWQNDQYVKSRELSEIKEGFEDFMRRVNTDYVDVGVISNVDEFKDFDIIMNSDYITYVRQLKRDGVIRAVELSTHNPKIGKLAIETGEIDAIMFSSNPAFDMKPGTEDLQDLYNPEYAEHLTGIDPERDELYKLCERDGIGLVIMKGYAGGRLFDVNVSPFGVAMTPVQCIHYGLTRPAACSVMVGMETAEQAYQALAYETATEAEKDYATFLATAPKHAFTGHCTYCGHCAPCPAGIDVAMVNKLYDLGAMTGTPSDILRSHYHGLAANAKDCTGCGGCETRCPFNVNVVERMKLARELFK